MDAIRERGPRVLFDTMHGSGAYPFQVILHTARGTVDTINLNKDAYFGGGMPAPTEQTLAHLKDMVIKGEYDFGRMKMFLSAGLEGYYIVPRLFNRPEILSVTVEN